MNKQLLASVLAKNGNTQSDLANVLGLSLSRTNAKINEADGAQFTQNEIAAIKKAYALTAEEIDEIFLLQKYLKKIQSHKLRGSERMGNLPKVEIRSEDGFHGEVWIDGMKLKGVRRVDFSIDAEREQAQELVIHMNANVDIETKALPKFTPWDLQKE